MNATTLHALLDESALALAGLEGVSVQIGFCREPYFRTIHQPILSLQIEEAKLSECGMYQTLGQSVSGYLKGQMADVTLSAVLYLPLMETGISAEDVFEQFFASLSGTDSPFTQFWMGQTCFLEGAQCFEAKMSAGGQLLLSSEQSETPIQNVQLQIGEVH